MELYIRQQVGLPDIPYFMGNPIFQPPSPNSPISQNEAIWEQAEQAANSLPSIL